jgi:L-threonylcarbamoyladenylate synthase
MVLGAQAMENKTGVILLEYYKMDSKAPDYKILDKAVKALKNGGLLLYPTDTLYGLGVDMTSRAAVARLYAIKERNPQFPVSLMVASVQKIEAIAGVQPVEVRNCLLELLPGKITALIKNENQTDAQTQFSYAGEAKLGFRIPDDHICEYLTKQLDRPISTTSANLSGKPNVYSVQEIMAQLGNKADVVLDAGVLENSKGSTVVDFTTIPFSIRREGDLSIKEVQKQLNRITKNN